MTNNIQFILAKLRTMYFITLSLVMIIASVSASAQQIPDSTLESLSRRIVGIEYQHFWMMFTYNTATAGKKLTFNTSDAFTVEDLDVYVKSRQMTELPFHGPNLLFFHCAYTATLPPRDYVLAWSPRGTVYFLHNFSVNDFPSLVEHEIGIVDTETQARKVAELYIRTVWRDPYYKLEIVDSIESTVQDCQVDSMNSNSTEKGQHCYEVRLVTNEPQRGRQVTHQFLFTNGYFDRHIADTVVDKRRR